MLLLNHPLVLFVVTFLSLWFAAWIGMLIRSRRHELSEGVRSDYSTVIGATLTLLGLLIGFTFSMATTRYDLRKSLEEEEANAIGTEYVRAGFHGFDGEIRVSVGQGVDGDDVRFQFGERLLEVREFLRARERVRQFAVGDVALADPDDFEAGNARIGQGMAHAHVAEADDENSLDHLFPLVVSLRAGRRPRNPRASVPAP